MPLTDKQGGSIITSKRQQTKYDRERGKAYLGFRRIDPKSSHKIAHDVKRETRKIRPRCDKCDKFKNTRKCSLITDDERKDLFKVFWDDWSWDAKKMYVRMLVEKREPQRVKAGAGSRREVSNFYHLKVNDVKIPVCKTMFMSTLGLTEDEVRDWIKVKEVSDNETSEEVSEVNVHEFVPDPNQQFN